MEYCFQLLVMRAKFCFIEEFFSMLWGVKGDLHCRTLMSMAGKLVWFGGFGALYLAMSIGVLRRSASDMTIFQL